MSRKSDLRNAPKSGRFGGAQQGAVTPGAFIKAVPPTKPPGPEFSLDRGNGDVVVDAEYSALQNRLKLIKALSSGPDAKLKYGSIYKTAAAYSNPPDPMPSWADASLPAAFAHGDSLPTTLPTGLAVARLAAGSLPIGSSAWDADQTTFGSEKVLPDISPFLVMAQVDTGTVTLNLWFSSAVGIIAVTDTDNPINYVAVVTTSSNPLSIISVGLGEGANQVMLGLSRGVNFETETLTLRLRSGLIAVNAALNATTNSAAAGYPVTYPRAKDCYVFVQNRAGQASIPAGNFVVISGYSLIIDELDVPTAKPAYDVLALGQGTSSSPKAYGKVFGGNAFPTSGTSTADFVYPSYRPFIFALEATEDPDKPDDWSALVLPLTFKHGDDLPTPALPSGVGWVRLARGSAPLQGSTWDADATAFGSTDDDPDNAPSLVRAQIRSDGQLYLYWSEAVSWPVLFPLLPVSLIVSLTSSSGEAISVVDHVSTSTNVSVFSLSRTPDSSTETITLALGEGQPNAPRRAVQDADNNWNVLTVADPNVYYGYPRNCYVLAINRTAQRVLRDGDFVDLSDDGETLKDTSDSATAKSLADSLPRISQSSMPHRHLNEGGGSQGGGLAFASFAPSSYADFVALGYQNIVPGKDS